jgi:hypothetical protein
VVSWFEAKGVRIPAGQRKKHHARILEAHAAQEMAAYREAVNGYEAAARVAYRRLPRRGKGKAGE